MERRRRSVLACGFACVAGALFAQGTAPETAGVEQAVGVHARAFAARTGAAAGAYLLGADACLRLNLDGSLLLDEGLVYAPPSARLEVSSGELVLASAAAEGFAAPAAVLARAAMWLDAGVNVVCGEDGAVREWRDVREAADAPVADCRYTRAVADHSFVAASPVRRTVGASPSLFFGGARSGVAMHFSRGVDAEGVSTTNECAGIVHAFVVHAVFTSYGYVLGGARNAPHSFGLLYSNAQPDQPVAGRNPADATPLYIARVYQNGELVDPQHTSVLTNQISIQEYDFPFPGRASAFYNDRFLNGTIDRTGGDDLCEVVIFTNRLTEAERLAVGAYLGARHLGARRTAPVLAVARGAAVRVPTAEGEERLLARVAGEGRLCVDGAGTLALTNEAAAAFAGTVALSAGEARLRLGPAVPLAVAAGTVVDVSDQEVTARAGEARTFVKTGNGTAVIAGVPDAVERLTVAGGVLALTSAAPAATVATGGVFQAAVTDPSFEHLGTKTFGRIDAGTPVHRYENGIEVYGVENCSGVSSYCGYYSPLDTSGSVGNDVPVPDGNYAMFLAVKSSMSIPVVFPRDGIYELSFMAAARNGTRKGQQHRIRLAQGGVTQEVSTVTTWDHARYRRFAYLCPKVAAGEARLLFEGVVEPWACNAGTLFDCIDLQYVKDADEDEEVFKVPGGDFEDVIWPVMADATRTYDPARRFSFASNCVFQAVRGWTFFQPEGFAGVGIPAEIGLAFPAMQEKASHPSRYCNSGEIRYGENVLTLVCADADKPGRALAGPFRAPAGRWRVRADVGWFVYADSGSGAYYNMQDAAVRVRAKVGDGAFADLGTLSTASKLMTPMTTDGVCELASAGEVTLEFTPTRAQSVLQLDHVVLVREAAAMRPGTVLDVDGAPAASSRWATEACADEGGPYSAVQKWWHGNQYGGFEICPGRTTDDAYLLVVQRAVAKTPVAFPAAGTYRLSFWAAERHDMAGQAHRGKNPLEAWLVDARGVTNCIGWTKVENDHWVESAFLFEVPEAGTYTLGIQGMTRFAADDPSNNHAARLDRVSVAYAGGAGAAAPPLNGGLRIAVEEGALLRLDYIGTNRVEEVRIAGRSHVGVVSAAACPELGHALSGAGALFVQPRGTVLLLR